MSKDEQKSSEPQKECPVDHNARQAWMKNGGEGSSCPVDHSSKKNDENCSSARSDQHSFVGRNGISSNTGLSLQREVSSIPRADGDKNWIYPSQQQFFDAMKRKNFDPQAQDMKSIIPIHNAVNERAWMEILKWEDGQGGNTCGGPKLVKFQGDSSKLTPTARWNMFMGKQKPFDRHDWVIDRCGQQVEYVIDFYTGKANPVAPDMPSFYLDARPKLNSYEGIRMRLAGLFK